VIAVADLAEAGDDLEARYGLISVEGGRHPWGTANRIVPLGDSYLELVAVVDHVAAAENPFGSLVAAATGPLELVGWAVRTDDLERAAGRLGLSIAVGSRGNLRWRTAGLETAAAEPSLPFFIEWEPGLPHPGRGGTAQLVELRLEGDADRLGSWLGPHELPITIRPGVPRVAGVVLEGGIVL
jgi:hypothetical protein